MRVEHPESPDAALAALLEGNERHRSGEREFRDHSRIDDATEGQTPFAAVVACADSRVAPTLIFDVERGNLFACRVAGNSIGPDILGSIEFAVAVLGVKAVMVLGHTGCGAVDAALGVATGGPGFPADTHGAIGEVVGRILPVVESLPEGDRDLDECVEANARVQARMLAESQPIIAPAVEAGDLKVAAGVYDIGSGKVSLLADTD